MKDFFWNQFLTHLSIRRLRLLFNGDEFNNYYKFTFIRNPWDINYFLAIDI